MFSHSRMLSSNLFIKNLRLSSTKFNSLTPLYIHSTRKFSSFIDFNESLIDVWPIKKRNFVINICPQGYCMIVERLGRFHRIENSGLFFVWPFVEKISFVIDMREKALNIPPQSAITKDNVHVHVSGNLYCQFLDASQAAYGSTNPLYAVKQHAQSSMRAAIGELELDEILHARAKLNSIIRSSITESAINWGIEIKRYEITEVSPDRYITEAMDKQAAAERERRKKVLDAEGNKKSLELESEGHKISLINESEGNKIKLQNEGEGKKIQTLLEAEGSAQALLIKSKAQAESLKIIANILNESKMEEAVKLELAKLYIDMYSDIGQKSNTMIFNDRPADITALMAQVSTILKNHPVSPQPQIPQTNKKITEDIQYGGGIPPSNYK